MNTLLNLIITLIALGLPAGIVFRAKPSMPKGKKFLIYVLAVAVSWILIIIATELTTKLDFYYAPTAEAELYLSMHDSGPRVGALIGGWIPATIYVLFLVGIYPLIKKWAQGSRRIKSFR
jgi:hypothetical protein